MIPKCVIKLKIESEFNMRLQYTDISYHFKKYANISNFMINVTKKIEGIGTVDHEIDTGFTASLIK